MNRNLTKATIVGLAGIFTAGSAMAQFGFGWPELCAGPTTKIYSDTYGGEFDWNDLMGVYVGVSGTVTYGTGCYASDITLDTRGRIGFFGGAQGSVQDTAYGGPDLDSWLGMTFGAYGGVSGNQGYAKTIRQEGTGTPTRTLFGNAAIDTAYYGASERYFVTETTNDNIRIHLRCDIAGDAARLEWNLTNQGAQANIGLEFGQNVALLGPQWIGSAEFIDVPGYRPLVTDHRFARDPNLNSTNPREYPMPPYANFGMTQSWAYGIQVPTTPNSAIPDQTPVDILDIGKSAWLIGVETGNDTPMPPYTSGVILDDTSIVDTGYVQRWFPTQVDQGAKRVITAYYKTVWGVSNYERPYTVTVDTPKVVAVGDNDPNTFNPNPMVIRVYVDNTKGYSDVNKPIPLNDVRIQLDLPQGMTDANNPSSNRMVGYIPVVPAISARNTIDPGLDAEHHELKYFDFRVNVDPTLFGVKTYTVTVSASPGGTRTLTGSIVVASQPRLQIKAAANLVSAPWKFTDTTWATILGNSSDPLQINRDFQAFEWDAAQQAYVLQTGPKRGFGNWIISTKDVGFTQLGGNPQTPPDLKDGAPLIVVRPGWNLIADPYNYAIPISQIVGVADTDPRDSQSFADLATQNIISPTLSYWDQNTQSYKFTTSFTDLLVPNRGYWLYVNSTGNVTLSFGPVYQAFIPRGTGGITKPNGGPPNRLATKPSGLNVTSKWKLNLTVRSNNTLDDQNFIGVAKNVADVANARIMKPPVSPTPNAISAAITKLNGSSTRQLAQSLLADAPRNEWNWDVYTKSFGATTIAWPNVKNVPSGVKLTLVDLTNYRSVDMRAVSSYTYTAQAQSTRNFRIVAEKNTVYSGPVITSVSAVRSAPGKNAPFNINYQLGTAATTTVRILSNGKEVYVVTRNRQDKAGANSTSWSQNDAANRRVRPGIYTIEVSATASGRNTEVKTTQVFVY